MDETWSYRPCHQQNDTKQGGDNVTPAIVN